jgi:hypothetical protein
MNQQIRSTQARGIVLTDFGKALVFTLGQRELWQPHI